MTREDGRCSFCGEALNPSSPTCPSCRRNIFQSPISGSSEYKIQPPPPSIALTPRNLVIGGVIVLLIATVPLITFLSSSRSGSNQLSPTPTAKAVIVHDQPTQTPTIAPTPTPITVSMLTATPTSSSKNILYQADWSNGLNGWIGGGEWKVLDGILINDGTSNNNCGKLSIIPHLQPKISDYAIEVRMQVIRTTGSGSSCFALNARSGYNNGHIIEYIGNIGCCGDIEIYDASNYNQFIRTSFDPSGNWHTYRFEVKGTDLKLLIDGTAIAEASDARYLGITGQVGLSDETMYVNISSFAVYSL